MLKLLNFLSEKRLKSYRNLIEYINVYKAMEIFFYVFFFVNERQIYIYEENVVIINTLLIIQDVSFLSRRAMSSMFRN